MSIPILDGPRLLPKSGKIKQLVVFVHGYGADGNDLIGIGTEWADKLPDALFVSPHAPESCAMAPVGRQWFGLDTRTSAEYWNGAQSAHPALNLFLDNELASHRLENKDLILVGFSQGGMMTLHTGLRRATAPAALVSFSGWLAGPESLQADLSCKPPILLAHGTQDQIVPFEAMAMAEDALGQMGVPVKTYAAIGLAHGIDGEGLNLALQHIVDNIG